MHLGQLLVVEQGVADGDPAAKAGGGLLFLAGMAIVGGENPIDFYLRVFHSPLFGQRESLLHHVDGFAVDVHFCVARSHEAVYQRDVAVFVRSEGEDVEDAPVALQGLSVLPAGLGRQPLQKKFAEFVVGGFLLPQQLFVFAPYLTHG